MKEELKNRMIVVIGSYPNPLIESIAEQCAQVAFDFYKEREQALDKSKVRESSLSCKKCGGYFGVNINHRCFKCLEKLF
jgi:hypothetical protein